MKISTKLIMLLVTAVVSVMAVYALVTISGTRERLDEEMRKMAEHIGLALSVGALHHLGEGDIHGVSEVLETISHNADVVGAAIFDTDGRLVSSSSSILANLEGEEQVYVHTQGIHRSEGAEEHTYICSIQDVDGHVVGSLRLVLRKRSMLPYVLEIRNQVLATIVVLTFILSLLVIYASKKQIAEPLEVLTEGADAIGRGELNRRIEINGKGELGTLAEAFNRMASNLEASNQKLVAEREHIQGIVDSIPEGVFVIDSQGRVTAWNQTMNLTFGLPLEKVLGKRLQEALPDVDSDDFWRMMDCLLNAEMEKCEVRDMRVKAAPGQVLSAVGSPLKEAGKNEGGAVLVMIDITERVRLERHIQQSEKLAAVGQLAAGVAHEIGTPLNVISGSAEYLLIDDPGAEELRTIVSEVGRITDLVKRLMTFARQEEPKVEPVDIVGLAESVLALLRRQMEKQGIHIEVNLASDLPDVMGDKDQLQQVFLNLVMNAWQAMPGGGTLRLEGQYDVNADATNQNGETLFPCLKLTVKDTGIGIFENNIQKVFDPFFTTKDVGEGTGLGLSIVHRIVEDHDGRITVTSREEEGSTFTVFLPVDRGTEHEGQ